MIPVCVCDEARGPSGAVHLTVRETARHCQEPEGVLCVERESCSTRGGGHRFARPHRCSLRSQERGAGIAFARPHLCSLRSRSVLCGDLWLPCSFGAYTWEQSHVFGVGGEICSTWNCSRSAVSHEFALCAEQGYSKGPSGPKRNQRWDQVRLSLDYRMVDEDWEFIQYFSKEEMGVSLLW